MNSKKFVQQDENGNAWGIVQLEQLWADVYALKFNRPEKRLDHKIWLSLFAQAKDAAIDFGAGKLISRIRSDYEPQMLRAVLSELGLKKESGRIEYQSDVGILPNDEGSPLTWKTAKELGWDISQIVNFTKDVTKDALDVDPNENHEDFIQDWLKHDELTSGLDCIAIGFLNDQACALVIAQVNKETGWSRLSYLGLIPQFRRKGLSQWVHRHGFTMMKNQGGKQYHGGTHSENLPMQRLFEKHGCRLFCEMEEWSCSL